MLFSAPRKCMFSPASQPDSQHWQRVHRHDAFFRKGGPAVPCRTPSSHDLPTDLVSSSFDPSTERRRGSAQGRSFPPSGSLATPFFPPEIEDQTPIPDLLAGLSVTFRMVRAFPPPAAGSPLAPCWRWMRSPWDYIKCASFFRKETSSRKFREHLQVRSFSALFSENSTDFFFSLFIAFHLFFFFFDQASFFFSPTGKCILQNGTNEAFLFLPGLQRAHRCEMSSSPLLQGCPLRPARGSWWRN